ncbi:MAG: class I SAM-dependent methyltransferase [Gemmatimonadales bacterium]
MLLNWLEYALMNNPVRALIQRRAEGPYLRRLGGPVRNGVALEIGAGRGVGVETIFAVFCARQVDAFDIDPRMVALARTRLRGRGGVTLWTGDATHIPRPDRSYDAVFDFGVLHHVPDWRGALREIARVLKPGGRLFAEEILRAAIVHPVVRRLLTHPQQDRFDLKDLRTTCDGVGLRPIAATSRWGAMAWLVAERTEDR